MPSPCWCCCSYDAAAPEGSVRWSVSLPRFGGTAIRRSVYIGTENTYTVERYQLALAKAVALREKAEAAYQRAATKAKRADGLTLEIKRIGIKRRRKV